MTKWGSPVSGYLTHPFGGPRFCEVESRIIKREHEGKREDTASGVGQGRSGGAEEGVGLGSSRTETDLGGLDVGAVEAVRDAVGTSVAGHLCTIAWSMRAK